MFPTQYELTEDATIQVDLGDGLVVGLKVKRNVSEVMAAELSEVDAIDFAQHYSKLYGKPVRADIVQVCEKLASSWVSPNADHGGLPSRDELVKFSLEHGPKFIALMQAYAESAGVATEKAVNDAVVNFPKDTPSTNGSSSHVSEGQEGTRETSQVNS